MLVTVRSAGYRFAEDASGAERDPPWGSVGRPPTDPRVPRRLGCERRRIGWRGSMQPSRSAEAVPGTADRQDDVLAELLPDMEDADVDHIGVAVEVATQICPSS